MRKLRLECLVRGLHQVAWLLIVLPDVEALVDFKAVPKNRRYEEADGAFGVVGCLTVAHGIGGAFCELRRRGFVGGRVMVVDVVVPSRRLLVGLHHVVLEDPPVLLGGFRFFAECPAYLECPPGKDLSVRVEVVAVLEEGREEPVRVVGVVS